MKINSYTTRLILFLLTYMVGAVNTWAQDTTVSTWDGSTTLTTIAAAKISGNGTEVNPYIIDSADKFVAFGTLADNSTDYWRLTADIDLGGHEWPYSGNTAKTFKGHFDGQNHIVKNYTITPISTKTNGLFGTVQGSNATTRAEIKDLKIDNVTILTTENLGSTTHIGALVGNASKYADFKNVQIVDADEDGSTVSITLDNLTGNCNIGGLIGSLQQFSTMENCTVNKPVILIQGEGAVKGTCYIGGAIGLMQGANATDVSKINKPASGSTNGLTVNDPSVTVHKITSTWYISTAIGCINNYSDVNYVTVRNPTLTYKAVGSPNIALYLGTLTGNLAGNVGSASATPVPTPVKNINITGTSSITIGTGTEEIKNVKAGVVGYAQNNVDIDTWTIGTSNITANGSLTTSSNYFGGVIGHAQSHTSAHDSDTQTKINNVTLGNSTITVTGNVVKESYIGSIFGRIEGHNGNASNKPKRTVVKDITTTGITKVVFGSEETPVSVANVRAGAIGSAAVNSDISTCTLADTEVKVYGNLITGSSYIGGIVGQVQSSTTAFPDVEQGAVATKVHGITVKESDVNVTGNVGVQCYVGGGFGQVTGATSTTVAWQPTEITNIDIKNDGETGLSNVTIGTNNTNTINYVRAGGIAGMANTNVIIDDWDIENANIVVNGKLQTTSSYVGGCIGHAQSVNNGPVTMSNMQITVSDVVAINGDIEKDTYIGGAFGRMDQNNSANNKAPTASNVNITGLDMSFGGDFKLHVYAGGIVGYLAAVNHTVTNLSSVVNCSVSGQIHSSASKTFVQDRTYAFGGIVGYNNQNATTNRSEIKQCISEVDINLGGYTPSTLAAGLSNLYKNGFAVAGVIGRLDNPSLLPEHLYYSGKIYAPFAVVGPIIGTFQKSLASSVTYVYDDYSGEYAAPTLTSQEWEKEKSWYYNNYQLGLSSAVITQTARTKNYTAATTTIDGVEYLTVTDDTFQEVNEINSGKLSRTVLRYTANNKDVDLGIFPNWNTNSVTYPEYYMYYMQGVNRGVYQENEKFAMELISNEVSVLPSIRNIKSEGEYTFTVALGEIEESSAFDISYQWYQSDETTAIVGATSKTVNFSDDVLESYGGTVYCKITITGTNFTPAVVYTLRGSNAYVVFVNGASGQDNIGDAITRGWTPETAVKTLNHANSLLRTTEDGGTVEDNIIVVMGTLNSDADFRSDGKNPATITGRYDGKDYAGIIKIKQINAGAGGTENEVNPINPSTEAKGSNCYVQADTKFEYLTFQANSNTAGNNFIELHGNDVTFGKGLSMTNFQNLSKSHGNLDAAQNIPELTIVLTATNLNEETIRKYTNREKPQVVTFESGRYGRIMGGRYTNGFFAANTNTSHTILGSAEHPVWAVVNVDIEKENPNVGTLNRGEAPSTGTVTNNFTCDINCIIAGLTDGSMYGDYQINVHGGKVGYIVGGNQGNPVPNGSKTFTQPDGKSGNWGQWPNATYFGRTVINVEQDANLKAIDIDNLYAGGLGREKNGNDASTTVVDMYLYGRTEVNMISGTVSGNVYGGGAGGVLGVNPWDMHLPYATAEADNAANAIMNKVQYCAQGVKPADDAVFASVTLHNLNDDGKTYSTEDLYLGTSSTKLNISGGTINGSVYGGGYGYVSNMPVKVTMQGVGSVFGTSNINITGGEIRGSVYGGSQGASEYYGKKNNYGQTIDHIAEMNGTVNLKILGTEALYPYIGGDIYGGGQGIVSTVQEDYHRIATTGNADLGDKYKTDVNIFIDLPENHPFEGNIYGGGEMGAVDGKTNVVIKSGYFDGNVYGGGQGEEGHTNKAKVTGETNVEIGTKTVNVPITSDELDPDAEGVVTITGSVFGGGQKAIVAGNTRVKVGDQD